jgi:hypothetical protein
MALLQLLVTLIAIFRGHAMRADQYRVPLHLLNILPFPDSRPDTGWDRAYELIPAAQLAIDQINAAPHILPGYELNLVNVDTEACGVSLVTKGIINTYAELFTPNSSLSVVALVGMFCSTMTDVIAPTFGKPNITYLQLAGSTSPAHRDSHKFPWLVHFISSADTVNDAMLELIREFGWRTVSVIFQSMNTFNVGNAVSLKQRSRDTQEFNVTVDIPITDKTDKVQTLTKVNSRIVYISAFNRDAAGLFCEAYKRRAVYPGYVYFLPAKSISGVLSEVDTTDCTSDQLTEALEGVFFLRHRLENEAKKLVSNLTFQEYKQQYLERLMRMESETNTTLDKNNVFANAMHDEIWAFALALGKAFNALHSANIHPEDLKLNQTREFAGILRSKFDDVSFEGASGFVKFNADKEESSVVDIYQVINSTRELVGVYDPDISKKLRLLRELSLPSDNFNMRTLVLPIWVSTFFTVYVLICMCATTCIVVFHCIYRGRPEIKASSLSLSLATVVGCYLLFVSTLIRNVSKGYSIANSHILTTFCNIQMWLAMVGLNLIFSALLLRLFRISRIFKAYGKVSPYWKNKYMILCIMAICLGGIIILILWTTVIGKIEVMTTITYQASSVPHFFERRFTCNTLSIGLVLSLVYNGILMVLIVSLAVQTRKIRLSNFKDTKQINAFITLTCMSLGVLVPLWYVIDEVYKYNILGHFIVSFALSCTGVYCQIFVFLPRVSVTVIHIIAERSGKLNLMGRESQFSVSHAFPSRIHPLQFPDD